MDRRKFIKNAGYGIGFATFTSQIVASAKNSLRSFRHGVASGDPLQNQIILWTRVTRPSDLPMKIEWQISHHPNFKEIVVKGETATSKEHDYCVKVDAILPKEEIPGTTYYYRFLAGNESSAIGRTHTLPEKNLKKVKLAVMSCSKYTAGFFNVYREIANRNDIDLVLHLGDYIYELGMGVFGDEDAQTMNRVVKPIYELNSLNDYRQRYAQHKSDPDSQAMLARHPLISVWDDHEISNDAWRLGAVNHSTDGSEGTFDNRKKNAIKAYFEWMPIRESRTHNGFIHRSFQIGDLVDLHMLDTRLIGRDQQVSYSNYTGLSTEQKPVHILNKNPNQFDSNKFNQDLLDPNRSILGLNQEMWLKNRLKKTNARWTVLGQQVMLAPQRWSVTKDLIEQESSGNSQELNMAMQKETIKPELTKNLDAWDGYPIARSRLYKTVAEHKKKLITLSGDTHFSSAHNLVDKSGQLIGVEFGTTSVTSPSFWDNVKINKIELENKQLDFNDHMQFLHLRNRGYLLVEIDREKTQGKWHLIDDVKTENYKTWVEKTLILERNGKDGLI
jgi:alkaline phosphatase D